MDSMLDRITAFSDRHRLAMSILGGVWFVLAWADTAKFIDLPTIPLVTDKAALWVSAAYNAIWWGFINPRIERRRKDCADMTSTGAQNG